MTMLNIEAIALDELGIYLAGKRSDTDSILETVYYISNTGGGIHLGRSIFTNDVMSIVSTSPGNQPYPTQTGLCNTILIKKLSFLIKKYNKTI